MTATREAWLSDAWRAVQTSFSIDAGDAALSVGHPARATRRVRLVDVVTDAEGNRQVYVSPYLADPAEILAVILWAACEASTDATRRTAESARARVGFHEPDRGDIIPGATLRESLVTLAQSFDPYPHVYTDPDAARRATQTTRMLKVTCEHGHEPYVLRMTRRQYDRGAPICPLCYSSMALSA